MSDKPKLTEKEEQAIAELQEIAKRWPKTLLLGSDCDGPCFTVWKSGGLGVHYGVAKIPRIKNMDEF